MPAVKLLASHAICHLGKYYGKTEHHLPTTPTPVHPYRAGRSLSNIGLMDYNARFYDPLLGRFTSPDKLIPNPNNSQDLNRFSYVRNNPIRYTDPSGNKILIDDDGMTVRYNSSGNKVIVDGGFTFPRAEKAIANYYLTGNDNYINYGLSGNNAQFVAKAVQNTEILITKSMIIHTEDEKDKEENSLIEFQYKLMGWALIFPTLYDFKLPTSNYPVDTEFNIYKWSENISSSQLFSPISTGAQAAIDLRKLSTPSKRSNRVFENQLTTDEAKTWFIRIADSGTVQPMNRIEGGFTGNVKDVEGAIINYRPYSSSPPFGPTIDIHGLPGFDPRTEIKFLGGIK